MKNLVKNLSIICCICLVVSCDDMNDIHQKYIDAGERVYLGKTDSLKAYPGFERVKLVWHVNANPKVETTVIYWNMRQDSIEKPFIRTDEEGQRDSIFIPLPEGTYLFEVFNKNALGERSTTSTVQGVSYGAKYASRLKVRKITDLTLIEYDFETQSSTIQIRWDDLPEGSIASQVKYKNRKTGEDVLASITGTERWLTLYDVGNLLGHPDDVLHLSSVYAPEGMIDPVETPAFQEQLVFYMASGTRVENTVYDGADATFTYTYVNQDKVLRWITETEGTVYSCSRVAELSPLAYSNFRLEILEDQTVSVNGEFVISENVISDAETKSTFDPATSSFTMRYTVKATGGVYTVEETLVPKNTPVEKEATKPFRDMRVSGDNMTQLDNGIYAFRAISDGVYPANGENGWYTNGEGNSFTFDLNESMKLTRMSLWPLSLANGWYWNGYQEHGYNTPLGYRNVIMFELWGSAEMNQSGDAAYWADADKDNPGNTYKADWTYLGTHEIDRIWLKNHIKAEVEEKRLYGHHFIIPEADPVRYIRFVVREAFRTSSPGLPPGGVPNEFSVGELSFWGNTP